jgi:hypothetical protein
MPWRVLFRRYRQSERAWTPQGRFFFFEKKKQKTFFQCVQHVPQMAISVPIVTDKSFLVLFFKKELLSFLNV